MFSGAAVARNRAKTHPGPREDFSQKLHLFNGELLNGRIAKDGSRLSRLLAAEKRPLEIIEELYVVALGRHPSPEERDHWQQQLQSADNNEEFLEDFVWGLVTSKEFTTNH